MVTTITVTGTYEKPHGGAAYGSVTFLLANPILDSDGNVIVYPADDNLSRADLDSNGSFSIDLAATNEPGTDPSGNTYLVKEAVNGSTRSFHIAVPYDADGATIDLADVSPIAPGTVRYSLDPPDGTAEVGDLLRVSATDPVALEAIDSGTFAPSNDVVWLDRDYGVHPNETALTNREAINQAISDAAGTPSQVSLAFLPGVHELDAAVGYAASGDIDIGVHLRGHGRRGTVLQQNDDTAQVVEWTSTTNNLRGIVMDDLTLQGGLGMHLDWAAYNLFRNITFWAQVAGSYGALSCSGGSSYANLLYGCWWVHNLARDMIDNESGRLFISASIFGEDAGGITCGGPLGHLEIVGSRFYDVASKLPSGDDGPNGEGGYLFNVNGAELSVTATSFSNLVGSRMSQFLITNEPGKVSIKVSPNIVVPSSVPFWRNRRMGNDDNVVNINGNHIRLLGTSPVLVEQILSDPSLYPRNSMLRNNTVAIDVGESGTIHDSMFDRARNNRADGNIVMEET